MTPEGDNPRLLCQDCSRPLFRWFMTKAGWISALKNGGSSE